MAVILHLAQNDIITIWKGTRNKNYNNLLLVSCGKDAEIVSSLECFQSLSKDRTSPYIIYAYPMIVIFLNEKFFQHGFSLYKDI